VTASSFDVTAPTCRQNSATCIRRVRVREHTDCNWARIHCAIMNPAFRSPQPRAVKNVNSAIRTSPSGTGTSSLDRLVSWCSQPCVWSKAGCCVSELASVGSSVASRLLGCHPAIFHGRQKSNCSQIWSRQSIETSFLLVVYQMARCPSPSPPPSVPCRRYASSRGLLGFVSSIVVFQLKHHRDICLVFEFPAIRAVRCLRHWTPSL